MPACPAPTTTTSTGDERMVMIAVRRSGCQPGACRALQSAERPLAEASRVGGRPPRSAESSITIRPSVMSRFHRPPSFTSAVTGLRRQPSGPGGQRAGQSKVPAIRPRGVGRGVRRSPNRQIGACVIPGRARIPGDRAEPRRNGTHVSADNLGGNMKTTARVQWDAASPVRRPLRMTRWLVARASEAATTTGLLRNGRSPADRAESPSAWCEQVAHRVLRRHPEAGEVPSSTLTVLHQVESTVR